MTLISQKSDFELRPTNLSTLLVHLLLAVTTTYALIPFEEEVRMTLRRRKCRCRECEDGVGERAHTIGLNVTIVT